jgi:hypothetical protein
VCPHCENRFAWKQIDKKVDNMEIKIKCKKCNQDGKASIIDVPYKSAENIKLVRINPEYIDIKYNDATGRHTYLYNIPDKLKRQIMSGDLDILEDTPKIYIDAIKQRKKIKLSHQNLFHIKLPTLAGKDMGWGLPPMSVALKDLFHFYTLRRGQEAVMLEHITPFDILFPQSNGKMDPYVHSDLSNWKREMEKQLANKRRDPNYKAIMPFPVGYERLSGDGKSMLLTPELDFLAKSIIGSVGIPQEFVFGGNMQWSGSSISLRTLENDFLHHRSQLLQMNIWVMDRLRIYLGIPTPRSAKFSDFKMADDMQKLSMLIGMASNNKLDWEGILLEMGYDPKVVRDRLERESLFTAKLQKQEMLVGTEAQIKAQQMQATSQGQAQDLNPPDPNKEALVLAFANKLVLQDPASQEEALNRMGTLDMAFANQVSAALEAIRRGATGEQQGPQEQGPPQPKGTEGVKMPGEHGTGAAPQGAAPLPAPAAATKKPAKPIGGGADMRPMPQQKPPRRQGGI